MRYEIIHDNSLWDKIYKDRQYYHYPEDSDSFIYKTSRAWVCGIETIYYKNKKHWYIPSVVLECVSLFICPESKVVVVKDCKVFKATTKELKHYLDHLINTLITEFRDELAEALVDIRDRILLDNFGDA